MATKREKLKEERKTVPLTLDDINKAKPREKDYALFDGGGLYLSVKANGKKAWKMATRLNGKQVKLSFGDYPAVSLKDARKKRLEAQEQIAQGINPNEAKKQRKQAEIAKIENTFEKIARSWHQNTLPEWKPVTANDIIRRLELNVFPFIGRLSIADITHQQIIDVLKTVESRGRLKLPKD